ncbi:MAG: hypothetical protein KAG34_04960 [Cocleimonas sp.]|nr:hypothetical protein [Cocleimonas sp.]
MHATEERHATLAKGTNDNGRPFLYPAKLFEILDKEEPVDFKAFLGA